MTKIFGDFKKPVIFILFIIGIGDMFSMAAPYYLKYVIPGMWNFLHINQAQFDRLNALLGWTVLFTQLPGGWLATRFSSRKLFSAGLALIGLLSIWFTLIIQSTNLDAALSYKMLQIIFTGWGIAVSFLLWVPMMKLISQQAPINQQAKAFGVEGMFNGLAGLFFITGLGWWVTKAAQTGNNFPFIIFSYILAIGLLVSAVMIWFLVKEKEIIKLEGNNFVQSMKDIIAQTLSLRVWLLSFFVMGLYSMQIISSYYLKNTMVAMGVAATTVLFLSGFRSYGLRMLISTPFGIWADKRRSYVFTLIWLLTIALGVTVMFTLVPGWNENFINQSLTFQKGIKILISIWFVILGAIAWCTVILRMAQIVEIPIKKGQYANIIGIVSFIAFTPDAFLFLVGAKIGENYIDPVTNGYTMEGLKYIIYFAMGVALFGLLCGTWAFLINRKEMIEKKQTSYRWREVDNN